MVALGEGPEHPGVTISLDNLALLYRAQGKYAAAEPLYQRSLAIWEKELGPEHPGLATGLNNLAELHRIQGKYAQATRATLERLARKGRRDSTATPEPLARRARRVTQATQERPARKGPIEVVYQTAPRKDAEGNEYLTYYFQPAS